MKNSEFNIRDPFILPFEGKYYLYASNYPHGFMAYISDDMIEWSAPVSVIDFPEDFWATKDFWAPEVHLYKGNFYLLASLYSETANRGTQIFKASSPLGPFKPISAGPVTPTDWMCLDGTLYCDRKGIPYMVFCHEWLQIKNGTVCYAQLSDDLTHFVTEPRVMFAAKDYPFVRHITDEACNFVTDGPFLHRCENGDLLMIWSSFGENGYLESVLKSDNGEIDGKWEAQNLLFEKDGGHGMLFRDFSGNLKLPLHYPNSNDEHLVLFDVIETDGVLSLDNPCFLLSNCVENHYMT